MIVVNEDEDRSNVKESLMQYYYCCTGVNALKNLRCMEFSYLNIEH